MNNKIINILLISFLVFATNDIFAQTIVVPDDLEGWEKSWEASINGSQATFNNWSEGGVNTLSGTAATVFSSFYRSNRFSYGFRTNLRYGQSRLDGKEVRKSDDLISIRNRATYDLAEGSIYAAYASVQFKTQFDDGFEYGKGFGGSDSLISSFISPAYLTEGLGIEVNINQNLKVEGGLAMKQTIISNGDLAPNYGLNKGDTFRSEGGFGLGISYQNVIMENITFTTSLETFSNLLYPIKRTDVFWASEIKGRINKLISANFQFELKYDDDFSKEIQLKQVLSAGLTLNIF